MGVGARQTGDHRVNRGGSWNSNARNVRAAYRNHDDPDIRNHDLGLRLARAQGLAGAHTPDPPRHLSADNPVGGEKQEGAGVFVARAEPRVSARRPSTCLVRSARGRR
jgi:hypothetical protein